MPMGITVGRVVPGESGRGQTIKAAVHIQIDDDSVEAFGGEQAVIAAVFQGLSFGAKGDAYRIPPVEVAEDAPKPGLTEDDLAELMKDAGGNDVERS